MALATAGMTLALAGLLVVLRPSLAHPDARGVIALLATCAAGGLVYGLLGAVLGVVRLSEMRFLMRRQPGVRPADPGEQP
jgi:putative peptidoglycan lipid II flippase